jgi:uncharacterized membrane protein
MIYIHIYICVFELSCTSILVWIMFRADHKAAKENKIDEYSKADIKVERTEEKSKYESYNQL